mmetsp:Transcript_49695/g.153472  ORF Transcript_49695/g.153472 Transcript_49695/m.153472 type:complete len:460 (-) Transcript_49695:81-1460(-)|eukprot:CAMPEP_0204589084 /NCGR_PEP_ID=MMETSP0661-20131031/48993_1 /ASSEMBLY_ACC=CAM_ASM_000606 /TAXON_ID=109239 /ORGANISM="Alexandrium margalefi, Strain AMGDE01CS-322" /LENGTH=459 /DNA_ID=CAMNT_0051598969 /DNA_START=96 /DNA_END=1475 /DNA_ORIENTATION=+
MKVVRDSKFRHVFGEPQKQRYEDLRLSTKATESTGVRGNSKFFAFAWDSGGGGTLAVVPTSRYGRLPRDLPLVTGHTGPILDFEFNPFDDNMVASASEDMTIKLWKIPDDGMKQHMRESLASLDGHGKKVSFCTFNPTAGNIMASTSFDLTCKIWNLAEQEEAFSLPVPDQVMSLKWNYNGSLLASTCKDKKLRIIDPRDGKIAHDLKIHDGAKASKVEWLGSTSSTDECYKLVSTGFSQQAERQIGIWDMRKFSTESEVEPLEMLTLDQGTGALYPFFDPGTQMLFIAGKGDANVRYFEAVPTEPYLHFIDDFRSGTTPQKGFCFFPKRCVDTTKHEVMRGLKLETTAVIPISFKVPRKSEAFQEDIFPDCPAGVPAMAAEEWVSTTEARGPILQSMQPGADVSAVAAKAASAAASASAGVVSMKDLKKQLSEAQAKILALETENEALKAELAQLKGS